MAQITIDDSLYPVIVQTMHGVVCDEDLDAMMSWYERFLRDGRRHALIVHAEAGHRPLTAAQRKRIADWQNRVIDRARPSSVGTAVILESAVQRGALTTLNWIAPPPAPQKAVATMREALDFCIERLEAAGIEVPEPVHQHRRMLEAGVRGA